jgi:pimeloyl-ACP methyl ester carboxylesterase
MPFAEVRGRRIYYEIHGEGDTVVLLHHGFASTRMWTQIYPSLVEAGYRVVMYDRRGYGQSEPGEDFDEFYVSDDFVQDSAKDLAELSKVLDLGTFHIVGQCEGGVVGTDYAGTFPQKVRSLVISSTLAFSTTTIVEFNRLKFPKAFHELNDGIRDKIVLWHGADRAEPFYEMARTRGGAYGIDMFDLRPKLRYVTCPALVVYPDRSALFDVEQGVALYRGLLKGELAVIPRCGHNTYEQYEAYSRHVLNFLNRFTEGANAQSTDFSMTCIAPAPSGSG